MKLLFYLLFFYLFYKVFFPSGLLNQGQNEKAEKGKNNKIKISDNDKDDGEYIDYEEVD